MAARNKSSHNETAVVFVTNAVPVVSFADRKVDTRKGGAETSTTEWCNGGGKKKHTNA